MLTESGLSILQERFAWIDLMSRPSRPGTIELMVIQRDHVKLRMRAEANHSLPHFHLEYKNLHEASYQISPFQKLAGKMPKKYENTLSEWISNNEANLLATWSALKSGQDVRELVVVCPSPDKPVEVTPLRSAPNLRH